MAYSARVSGIQKNSAGFYVLAELLQDDAVVASANVNIPDGTSGPAAKNLIKAALQNERTLLERTPPVAVGDSITLT